MSLSPWSVPNDVQCRQLNLNTMFCGIFSCHKWIRLGNPRNYTYYSLLGFSMNIEVERNPKTRISACFDYWCSSEVNEGVRTSSVLTLFLCHKWIRLGNPRNYTHYSLLGFSMNMEIERNPKTRISACFDDWCSSEVNESIQPSSFLTCHK